MEFFHAFRKPRGQRALLLAQPGHVRVAEHGHAIRRDGHHLLYGVREALGGLQRQAIDQVDVDAVKAKPARFFNQRARHFQRLHAMNRFLHFWMKILNAHAQAVEAQLPQHLKMRERCDARIDLNPDFCVRRERKTLCREAEQAFHLFRRQIRGCATAPVKLHHGPLARNEAADVLDFALQNFNVGRCHAVILGDHHVAGAEQAQAFAEGKMHVQGHRRSRGVGRGIELFQIVRTEIILPDRRGGIARVARARTIVFFQKRFGNFEAFAIELQMEA